EREAGIPGRNSWHLSSGCERGFFGEGGELGVQRAAEGGASSAALRVSDEVGEPGEDLAALELAQGADQRDVGDRELAGDPLAAAERIGQAAELLFDLFEQDRLARFGPVLAGMEQQHG